MYICTFLGVCMQHLNIPNKIRTSKNVHMTSFSHLVSLEKTNLSCKNHRFIPSFSFINLLHSRL